VSGSVSGSGSVSVSGSVTTLAMNTQATAATYRHQS
jgi:hypothetical protein